MRQRVVLFWMLTCVIAAVAGCAPRRAAVETARPAASTPSPGALEPIEVAFEPGTLPRSAAFGQAVFTVVGGLVTNMHPYTIFGEPKPGPQLYGVLDVRATNAGESRIDYVFGTEAFRLRTYSGAVLETVHPVGTYDFSRLAGGATDLEDQLVFPVRTVDEFDGAALLIGEPPDAPAVLELTAPPAGDGVQSVTARESNVHVGPVSWTLIDGRVALDRPAGLCCPKTGVRADADERFVTLTLRATVQGSQYGHGSITTDLVSLVADGTTLEVLRYGGQANVQEGESIELQAVFLIDASTSTLQLRFTNGLESRTIDLDVAAP